MRPIAILCPLLLLASAACAAQSCGQDGLAAAAARVKAGQSRLIAYKAQSDMDPEVPKALQAEIHGFKGALVAAADAVLGCAPATVDPKAIESSLAAALDANHPTPAQETYDAKKPPVLDHVYGDGLRVKVTAPAAVRRLLLVELSFGIACGSDSVLLGYELSGGHWRRTFRWQSGDYAESKDAFGDFFQYEAFAPTGSPTWLLATFHGSPWCTSRWSGFSLDLLQPTAGGRPPASVLHRQEDYVRDVDPVLKLVPGGFQIRVSTGCLDRDIMTRPAIYRYRVDATKDGKFNLQRVQPIAVNGRDFVDEWLQAPWSEVKDWSDPASLPALESAYKRIAALEDPKAKSRPEFEYGPVRRCSDSPAHFQVEFDEDWSTTGTQRPATTEYFQILQGKNSFTMAGVSATPDSRCKGADIMPRQ